jgi:S1-C subfamily serine protease
MRFLKYLSIFFLSFLLYSCNNNEILKPEEIYNKFEKSVVLINHEYYYQVIFKNGIKFYFTSIIEDEFQNPTIDENEIITNTIYGTGFFVNRNGLICTNNHVTSPQPSEIETDLTKCVTNFLITNYEWYDEELINLSNYYSEIENNPEQYNYSEKQEILNSYLFWGKIKKNNFILTNEDYEIQIITSRLGVAFNNTFANSVEDFEECVERLPDVNRQEDLALIQLKNMTTPSFVKNIINLNSTIKPKIDTKVYMIGFNYGAEIAESSEGLKNQLTQGTVSQSPDNYKVLYSIPTLQGSSGSPIIDEYGNLFAINFSGYTETQNFNYGILPVHLKKLIKQLNE